MIEKDPRISQILECVLIATQVQQAGRSALLPKTCQQAMQHCFTKSFGLHLHWDRLFSTVFALGQKVQQAVAFGQGVQELTQLPRLWILL